MNSQTLDDLLARINALEKEFKSFRERFSALDDAAIKCYTDAAKEEKPKLRGRVPDETTPINTVVRFVPDGPLFFWKGDNRFSASPIIS